VRINNTHTTLTGTDHNRLQLLQLLTVSKNLCRTSAVNLVNLPVSATSCVRDRVRVLLQATFAAASNTSKHFLDETYRHGLRLHWNIT